MKEKKGKENNKRRHQGPREFSIQGGNGETSIKREGRKREKRERERERERLKRRRCEENGLRVRVMLVRYGKRCSLWYNLAGGVKVLMVWSGNNREVPVDRKYTHTHVTIPAHRFSENDRWTPHRSVFYLPLSYFYHSGYQDILIIGNFHTRLFVITMESRSFLNGDKNGSLIVG